MGKLKLALAVCASALVLSIAIAVTQVNNYKATVAQAQRTNDDEAAKAALKDRAAVAQSSLTLTRPLRASDILDAK